MFNQQGLEQLVRWSVAIIPGWRTGKSRQGPTTNGGCRSCQCPCQRETSKQPRYRSSSKWEQQTV